MKKALTAVLAAVMMLGLVACGGGSGGGSMELRIGQAEYAAHGTRGFAVATAVTNGDTVVKAILDEYQFLAASDAKGVPNSDEAFGENYASADMVLASKMDNDALYSSSMSSNGNATQALSVSFKAVEDYVAGKKLSDLEALVAKEATEVLDAVAGSTLTDTKGYIEAIIAAAKNAAGNTAVKVDGKAEDLKIGKVDYAAHGTRSFTVAVAVTMGDNVVLSYLDDFQFLAASDAKGVPNSDEAFGENIVEGQVLASKRENDELYSAGMKENGNATMGIAEGFNAVQAYASNKPLSEIEATSNMESEAAIDAVASSTLVDTNNYLKAIVEAAKAAK